MVDCRCEMTSILTFFINVNEDNHWILRCLPMKGLHHAKWTGYTYTNNSTDKDVPEHFDEKIFQELLLISLPFVNFCVWFNISQEICISTYLQLIDEYIYIYSCSWSNRWKHPLSIGFQLALHTTCSVGDRARKRFADWQRQEKKVAKIFLSHLCSRCC